MHPQVRGSSGQWQASVGRPKEPSDSEAFFTLSHDTTKCFNGRFDVVKHVWYSGLAEMS